MNLRRRRARDWEEPHAQLDLNQLVEEEVEVEEGREERGKERRGERRGEGKDGEKAEKRKMRRRPEAEGLAVSGRRDTQSEQPMPKVATLTGSTLSEMPGSKYASLDGTNRKTNGNSGDASSDYCRVYYPVQ